MLAAYVITNYFCVRILAQVAAHGRTNADLFASTGSAKWLIDIFSWDPQGFVTACQQYDYDTWRKRNFRRSVHFPFSTGNEPLNIVCC